MDTLDRDAHFNNFFGKTSSNHAKSCYVPVREQIDYQQLILGHNTSSVLDYDPKLMVFTLSKYKFVSKMLAKKRSVVEISCTDGWGSLFVSRTVENLLGTDFYRPHIDDAKEYIAPRCQNLTFMGYDILDGPLSGHGKVEGQFDGAYSLDVLEHIDPEQEALYMSNIAQSLTEDGVFIVGMPSLESQTYSSEVNRKAHINCKTEEGLIALAEQYYRNVFSFGMNDEVLHTGFGPMCHYRMAICVGPRREHR